MKTYGQFCSVARALDVIGDRWALLVVRELLLGPRRYTDLLRALPGIGTNVLSTRLRGLEAAQVIERRELPAPTPAALYELTDDGRDLRHVINELARWGGPRLTRPARGDAIEPRWFVLSVAATLDTSRFADGTRLGLQVDDEQFTIVITGGEAWASEGNPPDGTATLRGSLPDLFAASRGDRDATRRLSIDGDRDVGRTLVGAMTT